MENHEDILAGLDILETTQENSQENENIISTQEVITEGTAIEDSFVLEEIQQEAQETHLEIKQDNDETPASQEKTETKKSFSKKSLESGIFMLKYLCTSVSIFAVLLLVSNYSAYFNVVYSIIYAQEMEDTKVSLAASVAAANISETSQEESEEKQVDTFKQITSKQQESQEKEEKQESMHSINNLISQNSKSDIDLGIEITPYENRIIIPKIGKNIPLIDIKQKKVDGIDELNNIFMEELENGVIRYPGSGKPGEDGNAFIFGHSSNFPWMKGDYNDVFSLLDNVVFDDEVVVYYGQEKHTYKIRSKDVISPGDVSVLKSDENDRSKITLMTCWPIGTTLNRLVLTGELVNVEKK